MGERKQDRVPLAEDRNLCDVFSDLEHAFRPPCLSGEPRSWNLPLWLWQPVFGFHEFSSTTELQSLGLSPPRRGDQGRGMSVCLSAPLLSPNCPAGARLTVGLPHLG